MRNRSRTSAAGFQAPTGHRRLRVLLLVLLFAGLGGSAIWAGDAAADDLTRFELDDGSVIVGEALGLAGGVYRIRTQTLGDIDIEASRIRRMERASNAVLGPETFGAAGDNAAPEGYASQIQALQQRMVGDSSIMESIVALQQDPEIQRAIHDPELIGLITSGNVEALRNNEAFGRLMEQPGIRAIIEQLMSPDGGLR
ncbi:MAG: hypothetical protein LJE69_08375 [Thiohalocapsa sp.]|jgi:hypothetical protein|uniref:hypothetical protein n=1 Tax=Thiohalocapsa sp. TaxID=2497641 RepID=UPI0025CE264A|nr:hypothetical protein [Thiohalocapsa sp.]MCG6941252.1 hypothetical protein [Thiohalocapsa sp.]